MSGDFFYPQKMGRIILLGMEEIIGRTPFANCKLMGGVMEQECNALFGEPRNWF